MRVAQVVGKLNSAGVEAVVNNYCRSTNRDEIQFDYIIDSDSAYLSSEEMTAFGARYFTVPPTRRLFARIRALKKLFRDNNYRIVHSHMNTLNLPVLYAAWKEHVPVRISHNHSMTSIAEGKRYLAKTILRPTGKWFATDYIACGEAAGKWFFGKRAFDAGRVFVLPNAIDVRAYRFNQEERDRIRKKYGLENKWVIGHAGRFMKQKNHFFLIRVFAEIRRKRQDARLLLVGDGELKKQAEELCRSLRIEESVVFSGNQENMPAFYSAMDLFVLPSLYEGVPVVGLEAQANGLPCVFSDRVSEETKTTGNAAFLPLNATAWVNAVLHNDPQADRSNTDRTACDSIYNLDVSGTKLQAHYGSLLTGAAPEK
ncbi:MAG: glycosyltransferase family 1 protein [Clostridiales bacterium]|nr:glycosyltransferase family 1 protein [Clostridiales bacterium]